MTLGQNSPGRDLKNRYLLVGVTMVLGLLALVIQTYRLQITRHAEFNAKSEANFVKEVRLRADRGMIRDSQGEILVDNRPSFDLFVTPAFCEKCKTEVLPRVAELVDLQPEELEQIAEQLRAASRKAPFVPIPIKIDLDRDEVDRISSHKRDLDGVEVLAVPHRNYRTGTVMSHVLGYMNEITQDELDRMVKTGRTGYYLGDFIGRRGLERYFDAKLRGNDGMRKEVVNARGKTVSDLAELIHEEARPPKPGNNIVLSIDMRLQAEAERAFPGVAGAVVAIDVQTGFIRALVSRPGFDPNMLTGRVSPAQMATLSKDPLQPMIFRPTAQHYSPGSTYKVITALAALRSGHFHPHTSVFCGGGYRLGSRTWRCHKDSGHGYKDARGAMQASCDVWYYRAADSLGIDPIAEVARELGLGQPTGIGVVAEVPGIVPSEAYHDRVTPGGYTKGFALNTAIGQGDNNVTPLQLAMVYAAIANGGILHQPQLVERMEAPDGTVLERFDPKVVRKVEIPEEHRRVLIDSLKAVVNEAGGTAYSKRLKHIVVAGKTGTAQVSALGKVRLKTEQMSYFLRDHAWFAGFAPADEPELVVVVLNEHGGHGGSDAAPTAMAVINKYFELKAQDGGVENPPMVVARNAPPVARPLPLVSPTLPAPITMARVTAPAVRDAVQAAQIAAQSAEVKMNAPVAPTPVDEAPPEAPNAAPVVQPVYIGLPNAVEAALAAQPPSAPPSSRPAVPEVIAPPAQPPTPGGDATLRPEAAPTEAQQ